MMDKQKSKEYTGAFISEETKSKWRQQGYVIFCIFVKSFLFCNFVIIEKQKNYSYSDDRNYTFMPSTEGSFQSRCKFYILCKNDTVVFF